VARAAEFISAATHVAFGRQASLVEGYLMNPNRIPEGEQARREAPGR